jgi:uncharacterized membrane protein
MRSRWLGYVIVALAIGLSLWAFPQLPPRVPSHWSLRGEVNGYSSRWVAAFLFPLVLLGMRVAVNALPRIDPLGKNYARFTDTFWVFVNSVLVVLGLTHAATLANGLGFAVSMGRLAPAGVGILLMLLGNVLGRVEPNWFMGIRTPWTLSSEQVWRKTHRVGAWIFVVAGAAVAVGSLALPAVSVPVLVCAIGVVAAIPVVYSYILWKAEQRGTSH